MKTNKVLLKGGCVVTMDEQRHVFKRADVLITGERITAIQPDIDADDCDIIDASNMIVMPGFIDTHRHVWESVVRGTAGDYSLMDYLQHVLGPLAASFRAQDVYTANLLGSLEALDAGITTLFDWSHIMNTPDHADSAIAGLKDSGIRAVFGYGTPGTSVWEWFYESNLVHPTDIERIIQQHFSSSDQLVTPAMAIRGPEYSTFDVAVQDITLGRRLNLPISMHAGCGTFADKYQAVQHLASAGLLGPDLNFAHGNYLTVEDFKQLANSGCSVSITPEVEMQMGLGFPATGKAIAGGLAPSLGVDVVSGVSGELFTQMRMALQTERALVNDQLLRAGEMPQSVSLTMTEALTWATINGAKVLNLDRKTGSLVPGKQADLIMLNTDTLNLSPVGDPIAAIVSQANVANVDSVFVAGKAVKRQGRLLHPHLASVRQQAARTSSYLVEKALMASLASV
ncbi:amidohydrolase family protein [Spirosoma jeollabukense]